jgi:uncharacterized protein YhaN
MTEATKKRPRGRPPVPPAEKKVRNFTFRSRGDMHGRLSEASLRNERSISEEIESRIQQSFEFENRITDLRSEWKQRLDETRLLAQQSRDQLEAIVAETKQQMAEQSKDLEDLERKLDTHVASANMVDVMLGENEASRDLLRKIAFELMSNPGWDGSKAARKAMAAEIHRYIYDPEIFERGEK